MGNELVGRQAGYSTPEIGSLEGLWWRVTPFNAAPWTALGVPEEPLGQMLALGYWGATDLGCGH